MEKRIKDLRDHYIVCGYGRMGRIICRELKGRGVRYVVIEKNPLKLQGREETLIMEGDATQDEVLREAGIERAKGLISVLPTDAENLFVVLSARGLNLKLLIVARAEEEGSEQKLIRAGAGRVISPYHIGGLRIAHTVLKPAVVACTLDECGIGRELGSIIVAIRRASGEMKFNPTFRSTIQSGDILIALGEISKLKIQEEMAAAGP